MSTDIYKVLLNNFWRLDAQYF